MGGIAPFLTVSSETFSARPQCPDEPATEVLRRKRAGVMTINDNSRDLAGAAGHCSDPRKPEGLSGRWQVRGGEAAAALTPRQDAGRVPFLGR